MADIDTGWFPIHKFQPAPKSVKVGVAEVIMLPNAGSFSTNWGFVFDGKPAGKYVLRCEPGTICGARAYSATEHDLTVEFCLEYGLAIAVVEEWVQQYSPTPPTT